MRPYGDAVVWSRLTRAHGFVRSGEIAADVPIDAGRHGHAPGARAVALLEFVTSCSPTGPGAIEMRRELLRRLYLEPDPGIGAFDLVGLFGGSIQEPAVAAVVGDLEWALERQREALSAERVRWPVGEFETGDQIGAIQNEELIQLQAQLMTLGIEIAVRDSKIRRLEAEVYRRDAVIARIAQRPLQAPGGEA